jgi:hypothetical protein
MSRNAPHGKTIESGGESVHGHERVLNGFIDRHRGARGNRTGWQLGYAEVAIPTLRQRHAALILEPLACTPEHRRSVQPRPITFELCAGLEDVTDCPVVPEAHYDPERLTKPLSRTSQVSTLPSDIS